MKSNWICFCAVFLSVIAWTASSGFSVTLTLQNVSGSAGQALEVPLVVDDPSTISGAAFALEYSSSLSVLVDSTFFDTFYNQFEPLDSTGAPVQDGSGWKFPLLDESSTPVTDADGNPVYLPDRVEVGGYVYPQPVLDNAVPGETVRHFISGARCTPAAAEENPTLFTLRVSLKVGHPAGVYPIKIIPTSINNTDAGYNAAGETVDLLIGSDPGQPAGSPGAYPVLLAAGDPAGLVSGQVEFIGAGGSWSLDIDGNGAVSALTDGLLVMRYLMGFHLGGAGWTTGFRDPAAPSSESDIEAHLATGISLPALDIDGDGKIAYLTDGLLAMRYLLEFHLAGAGWTQGFRDPAATRDEAQIEAYLQTLMP